MAILPDLGAIVQLAFFERDADTLLSALVRTHYLEQSGRQPTLPLVPIYERFAEVYSLDAYEQLLDAEVEDRVGDALRRCVLRQHVEASLAARDQDQALQARLTMVEWGADAVPLRMAWQLLGDEEDRGRRHEFDERIREASQPLAGAALDRLMARRAALQPLAQYDLPTDDLGYSRLVTDTAVEDVSALAQHILTSTAELYSDALRDQLVHYGLDDQDAWEVDLEWIFRGEAYARVFPQARLMPAVVRALSDLDIRLQDQTQIRLDVEPLPGKVLTSMCAPVVVPDEIMVMLAPRGSAADFMSLFRRVGEAECYAHTERTQPLAYRRLGDRAAVAGYGQAFAGLLGRPEWLTLRLEAEATRDAIRMLAFERLYRLRRAAVSHLFEVDVRSAPEPDGFESRYVDLFQDALGIRPFAERMLDGFDDAFNGAIDLRAAIFGHQLSMFLEREFDEDWYRSARAGRFLVDRWREGQRYKVEELVRFLGFDGLDVEPLIGRLRSDLND